MIYRENYYLLLAAIIKKAVEDYNIEIDPNWKEPKNKFKIKHKRSAQAFFKIKRFERLCDAGGLNADDVRKRAGVVIEKN